MRVKAVNTMLNNIIDLNALRDCLELFDGSLTKHEMALDKRVYTVFKSVVKIAVIDAFPYLDYVVDTRLIDWDTLVNDIV